MDTSLKKFVAYGELKRQHLMGVMASDKEEAVAIIRAQLDDPSYQHAFTQWQAGGELVTEDFWSPMPPEPTDIHQPVMRVFPQFEYPIPCTGAGAFKLDIEPKLFIAYGTRDAKGKPVKRIMSTMAATIDEARIEFRRQLNRNGRYNILHDWTDNGEIVVEDTQLPAVPGISTYVVSPTMGIEPAPGSTHFQVTFGPDIPGVPEYVTGLIPIDQLEAVREEFDKRSRSVWATIFFYTRSPITLLAEQLRVIDCADDDDCN